MSCDEIGTITMPDGSPVYYDGLPTTNFKMIFGKAPFALLFLQEFQSPDISVGTVEYKTSYVDIQEIGEKMIFGDFTITFLVDKNLNNYREIFSWMKRMTVNGSIIGETDNPVLIVNNKQMLRLVDAWPKSLTALNFKTNENDVVYITATATFNVDYVEFFDQPFDKTT